MRSFPRTLREWVVVVFGAAGLAMVPWTIWLSSSLKPEHTTNRWDIAWSGFDFGLALAFVGTALAAARRSPWVGALSAATGTLLLTDAWFDVLLESHGNEMQNAIFLAVFAELPAAAFCFWIAFRTEKFLARMVDAALGLGAPSHLAAAGESPTEGDLVGVLEVAPDGQAAREPGDADATP